MVMLAGELRPVYRISTVEEGISEGVGGLAEDGVQVMVSKRQQALQQQRL